MAMLLCPAEAPSAAEGDTIKDAAKEAAPSTTDVAAKGSKNGKKIAAALPKRSKKGKKPKGGHAGKHMLFKVLQVDLQAAAEWQAHDDACPACLWCSFTAAQTGPLSTSCAAHRAPADRIRHAA